MENWKRWECILLGGLTFSSLVRLQITRMRWSGRINLRELLPATVTELALKDLEQWGECHPMGWAHYDLLGHVPLQLVELAIMGGMWTTACRAV